MVTTEPHRGEALFSKEPEAVLLLFGSVRAAAPTLVPALLLAVLLGLFPLLMGLLAFSGFWTGLVRGDLVVDMAWGFDLRAWLLLFRGLPTLLSGETLPDVESVVWEHWAFPGLSEVEP